MLTLFDVFDSYLHVYHGESNSNVTTHTYRFEEGNRMGTITLKWWKEKGMLLISHILLQAERQPMQAEQQNKKEEPKKKHVLTAAVKALQTEHHLGLGLQVVKLIGVANSTLSEKMVEQGWHAHEDSLSYTMDE